MASASLPDDPGNTRSSVAASEASELERHDHEEGEGDDDVDSLNEPPLHPIPAMQDAFEESIADAADGEDDRPLPPTNPDPDVRRRELLDRRDYDDSLSARWNLKPNAKSHPLVKLMAQIIFGLHLLHQSQAKSDAEVVKILQTHVDEIDAFLERTTEDFDAAESDIQERISYLKLPMTHLEVFDVMLDDRKFRNQLIDGNDRIEKIIERTAIAMNATLGDVQAGLAATLQLASYLYSIQTSWPQSTPEQAAILVAMRGNQEGWAACMRDLEQRADVLRESLVQLGTVIGEMSKLAAAASRRNHAKLKATTSPRLVQSPRYDRFYAPGFQSPHRRKPSVAEANKPLPHDPDTFGAAVRATAYKGSNNGHDVRDDRFVNPRSPPSHLSPRQPEKYTFQPSPNSSQAVHLRSASEAAPEALRVAVDTGPRAAVQHDYNYRVDPGPSSVQHHTPDSNPGSHSGSFRHNTLPDGHFPASPQRSSRSGSIDILSPPGMDSPKLPQWPVSEFSPKEKTGPSFSMKPIKKLFNRKKDQSLYI